MTRSTLAGLLVLAVLAVAAGIAYYSIGLPQPQGPPPLPWDESVTSEEVAGDDLSDLGSEPILYATPTGIWRRSRCEEHTVLLSDGLGLEGPISFPQSEGEVEITDRLSFDASGTYTFNRCNCGYRVEWDCTKVTRYVAASAVINGKSYVRYGYGAEIRGQYT